MKLKKPTSFKDLYIINTVALLFGLLLLMASITTRLPIWENDSHFRVAIGCLWGPVSSLLVILFAIYVVTLLVLNIDFLLKNREKITGTLLITACVPIVLAIMSVILIPSAVSLVDWFQNQIGVANIRRQSVRYEKVIEAIKQYSIERGQYPTDLYTLVPNYLPEAPGIYIEGGKMVDYLPQPSLGAPFTFYVYGYNTGKGLLRKWEEWELRYCPQDTCTYSSKSYSLQRITRDWIWIYRPESRPLLGRPIVLWPKSEPTPLPGWRYPTDYLFLDENDLPAGWRLTFPGSTPEPDPTINANAREYYEVGSSITVYQIIWRSFTVDAAQEKYLDRRKNEFRVPQQPIPAYSTYCEFTPPSEIVFRSEVADESYIACGVWDMAYCEVLARYRNYVTILRIDTAAECNGEHYHGLTYQEAEKVIEAMDSHFDKFLAEDP